MLSRLAGSVFHIGRAVERTDLVARLLDVYLQRVDDEPLAAERIICRELRTVAGAATGPRTELEAAATLESLALDRHEPASIAHAVATARDDARRARDAVSTELWDCLNVTRSRMPRKIAGVRAHEFLAWVRERSALAIGVVEADASRDEVWEFFTLGRAVERCAVTARLLGSDLLDPASDASWATALRACGAGEAFQREHRHPAHADEAAAFLLLDEHSPRSLRFVARRADECLAEVASERVDPALVRFAEARGALEATRPADAAVAARPIAERVRAAAAAVVAALDEHVFAVPGPAA